MAIVEVGDEVCKAWCHVCHIMAKQVEVWRHKIGTVTVRFCGSSTLVANLQLKPLPPTANLFVDFCAILFIP